MGDLDWTADHKLPTSSSSAKSCSRISINASANSASICSTQVIQFVSIQTYNFQLKKKMFQRHRTGFQLSSYYGLLKSRKK